MPSGNYGSPDGAFRYDIWCMGCVFYDISQSSLTNGKISQYSDLSKTFTNDYDNVHHLSTINSNLTYLVCNNYY